MGCIPERGLEKAIEHAQEIYRQNKERDYGETGYCDLQFFGLCGRSGLGKQLCFHILDIHGNRAFH